MHNKKVIIMIVAVLSLMTSVICFNMYKLYKNKADDYKEGFNNKTSAIEIFDNISTGILNLSENASNFIKTGDVLYIENYENEVNIDSHKDKGYNQYLLNRTDDNTDTYVYDALKYSKEMMNIEIYAMKLANKYYGSSYDFVNLNTNIYDSIDALLDEQQLYIKAKAMLDAYIAEGEDYTYSELKKLAFDSLNKYKDYMSEQHSSKISNNEKTLDKYSNLSLLMFVFGLLFAFTCIMMVALLIKLDRVFNEKVKDIKEKRETIAETEIIKEEIVKTKTINEKETVETTKEIKEETARKIENKTKEVIAEPEKKIEETSNKEDEVLVIKEEINEKTKVEDEFNVLFDSIDQANKDISNVGIYEEYSNVNDLIDSFSKNDFYKELKEVEENAKNNVNNIDKYDVLEDISTEDKDSVFKSKKY